MGFFDDVKSFANKTRASAEAEISKFKNKDVLDAIVGASVMIAAADGRIDASEKQKLLGILKNSALTKAYSTDQVIAKFTEHADRFEFDADIGRSEALRIISKQKSSVDVAKSIVRAAVMIAGADGNFDDDERKVVSQIIRELGLNEGDFDL
jgi:tellurite resistance protein TerB